MERRNIDEIDQRLKSGNTYINRIGDLAVDCGVQMTPRHLKALREVCIAMGATDLIHDDIKDPAARALFELAVVEFMNSGEVGEHLPPELIKYIKPIRDILLISSDEEEFARIVEDIFVAAKVIKEGTDTRARIAASMEEGRLVADAICLSLGEKGSPFHSIFLLIGAIDNLFDDLVDARKDYKEGEVVASPDLEFYQVAVASLLQVGVQLLRKYPNKLGLLRSSICALRHYALGN